MAILVDELREYPDVRLPFGVWCHMATDGSFDELHEFAARLGLRRAWFQRDHYDLPAHGRAAAVALGPRRWRRASCCSGWPGRAATAPAAARSRPPACSGSAATAALRCCATRLVRWS